MMPGTEQHSVCESCGDHFEPDSLESVEGFEGVYCDDCVAELPVYRRYDTWRTVRGREVGVFDRDFL